MKIENYLFTGNQKLAIESTDINTCVSAGAGTGKTFVLVQRFIQLLKEKKADISEIAAITFSEKAAKELKDRIRNACEPRQRKDLENARIGTIHSFCARILKENSIEAEIDPESRVLDEIEGLSLLDKLVHKKIMALLNKADTDTSFIVSEYGLKYTQDIIKTLIKYRIDIESLAKQFMAGNNDKYLRQWQEIDRKKKVKLIDALKYSSKWKRAFYLLDNYRSLNSSNALEQRRQAILALCRQNNKTKSLEEKINIILKINELSSAKIAGYEKADWDSYSLKAISKGMAGLFNILKTKKKYLQENPKEFDLKQAQVTRHIFKLYKYIERAYREYKNDNGLLDFDDLIIGAKKLLKEKKYIRKMYQNSIKYILVDEYQDTDFHQREIIFYLAEDTLHLPADSAEDIILSKDKLFIVGDSKQSIYKFRGADVSVFNDTQRIFQKAGRNIYLNTSLRSSPQLSAFFNDFFGKLMGRKDTDKKLYEVSYTDIHSARNVVQEKPQIELIAVSEDKISANALRIKEAELIARRIRHIVDKKENLVYKKTNNDSAENSRPANYADIALLFRAMSDVNIYEKSFRKYGIPYYIVSGSGFYGRQEIRDILNALKVLENSCDEIAMAGLLRSPMIGITDDNLYQLKQQGNSLFNAVKNAGTNEKLSFCWNLISKLKKIKNRISIASLIEELVRMTDYYAVLASNFIAIQQISNVRKIINTARQFEKNGMLQLGDFIKHIDELHKTQAKEGEAVIAGEEDNAVNIMTVHKAKGLEFPIVFIPDISRIFSENRGQVLYDRTLPGLGIKVKDEDSQMQNTTQRKWIYYENAQKRMAEAKRLLYVASTRAKDYLVYSGRFLDRDSYSEDRYTWSGWFRNYYNPDTSKNAIVNLTDKIKIRITVDIPEIEKNNSVKPLIKQYRQKIKQYKKLPYTSGEKDIIQVLEQIKPINKFYALKEKYTATEFIDYLRCPKRYELRHIIGIPEFHTHPNYGRISHSLLGTITHRFLEKWNLKEDTIPLLMKDIRNEAYMKQARIFIKAFRENTVYKQIENAIEFENELPITFKFGKYIIEGKIDKLFKTEKGWIILDYKTDNITKDKIYDEAKIYELQLGVYALGISRISNITPYKLILLFLAPGKAYTIDCNKAYIKKTEERLSRLINQIESNEFHPICSRQKKQSCPYKEICKINPA